MNVNVKVIVGPKTSTASASLTAQKTQELEYKIEKGFPEEVSDSDLQDLEELLELEKAKKNPDFPEVEKSPLIAPKIADFFFESDQNSEENKSWDDVGELELQKRISENFQCKDDAWTVLFYRIKSDVYFDLA